MSYNRIDLPRSAAQFDAESKMMFDLIRYAGIEIDPGLFQNVLDLLKSGF